MLDRYEMYEGCAQAPETTAALLRALHGGEPQTLGEDFCGAAGLSAAWIRAVPGGRAIAVDRDPEALARIPDVAGLEVVPGDVVGATDPARHGADLVYAGNCSIGEWQRRVDLLTYLRHVRRRLHPGGAFVCDVYGGATAFLVGDVTREIPLPDGRVAHYTWEQREADPATGLVVNAMHFRVSDGAAGADELPDAFVYRWRLWGVPELRDAMTEAGFDGTGVYPNVPDAIDDTGTAHVMPIRSAADLEEDFVVLVAARVDGI